MKKKTYKVEYCSKIAEIFIIALSVQSEQKIKGIRCIWVFIVLGIYDFGSLPKSRQKVDFSVTTKQQKIYFHGHTKKERRMSFIEEK